MDYFSADYHFGDERLHLFPRPFATPEQAREHIITVHNKQVTDSDTIYILGDIVLKEAELVHLNRMHGHKILIKGNYDTLPDDVYLKYVDAVHDFLPLTLTHNDQTLDVWLNHYPSKAISDRFNLVGHIHGAWRVQKNMINVGVDAAFFAPWSTPQILFLATAITKFYDNDVWCADHPANLAHAIRGKAGASASGSYVKR